MEHVHFNTGLAPLIALLEKRKYSKVYVLTDTNTGEACLPVFNEMHGGEADYDLIETDAGEVNKTLDYCMGIWSTLQDFGADRKALLINLGGGVVTDMGGFIASTYKRGIDFINIPTSLLAQVDAAVGGKTGVDLMGVKNAVGTFADAQLVLIEQAFLNTLPEREILSGYAEMLKHGIIADRQHFKTLAEHGPYSLTADDTETSVRIKERVVEQDPREGGLRKILNYGHTIGHAIESYSVQHDAQPISHGHAVGMGMYYESLMAEKLCDLPAEQGDEIRRVVKNHYELLAYDEAACNELLDYMAKDKKNKNGMLMFALPCEIGKCLYDVSATDEEVRRILLEK